MYQRLQKRTLVRQIKKLVEAITFILDKTGKLIHLPITAYFLHLWSFRTIFNLILDRSVQGNKTCGSKVFKTYTLRIWSLPTPWPEANMKRHKLNLSSSMQNLSAKQNTYNLIISETLVTSYVIKTWLSDAKSSLQSTSILTSIKIYPLLKI